MYEQKTVQHMVSARIPPELKKAIRTFCVENEVTFQEIISFLAQIIGSPNPNYKNLIENYCSEKNPYNGGVMISARVPCDYAFEVKKYSVKHGRKIKDIIFSLCTRIDSLFITAMNDYNKE